MTVDAPSRLSTRAALAALLVALLVAVSAGCDSGTPWVARVDGKTVHAQNFSQGIVPFAKLSGAPASDTSRGIVPISDAAQYALFLVQYRALLALNEQHGAKVSEADKAAIKQSLQTTQAQAIKGAPNWFVDQVVDAQANFQALINYYGARVDMGAQMRKYYAANKNQFVQVCMDVIGATEEAPLSSAKQEIQNGSVDFATAAKAVAAQQPPDSQGNPSKAFGTKGDGNVGCVSLTSVSQLFATPGDVRQLTDVGANTLVGPLPVAGGSFMLFRVRKVQTEPYAQAKAAIQQQLGQAGSSQAQAALSKYLQSADIEINPRYGTWVKGKGYEPPKGAEHPNSTTTLPSALSGAR